MNKIQFIKTLNDFKTPKDIYSTDKENNETLCLIEDGFTWVVFYSERGRRSEPKYFPKEELACEAFLYEIQKC